MASGSADIGVAIAAFRSGDVIGECLDSLLASQNANMRVVVVDNASPDDTCAIIRTWAAKHASRITFAEAGVGELAQATAWLTLLHAPRNGGFAYATNRALEALLADPALGLFWLLNPDARAAPDAAAQYIAASQHGAFALMGGRTLFAGHRDIVQTDGGRVSRWTGVCSSINANQPLTKATVPDAASLDFITGANCVASREFIAAQGLMREDYFLYYEEVDWAMRRGELPLRFVAEAMATHHGGTTIGSGSINRRPSPFANYFNHRSRMRFMRRFSPLTLPLGIAYGFAKAVQLWLLGARGEAYAVLAGMFGLRPPAQVRAVKPDK